MTNINFESLEAYLFTEDKQEFINKLVPGSEPHYFFSTLYALTKPDCQLTPELEDRIGKYHSSINSSYSKNIHLRGLLMKYDDPSTPSDVKNQIIDALVNQYVYGISFRQFKPPEISNSALESTKTQFPTSLDPQFVSLDLQLLENPDGFGMISRLRREGLTRIDPKKINNQSDLQHFIWYAEPSDFEEFPKVVVGREDLDFKRIPLNHMKEMLKLHPPFLQNRSFIMNYFEKAFGINSLPFISKDLTKQEIRDRLFKAYLWVSEVGLDSLVQALLFQILEVDMKLNRYQIDLFVKFLKDIKSRSSNSSGQFPGSLHSYSELDLKETEKFLDLYLKEIFKNSEDIKPFDEFFDNQYLNTLFYSAKLMLGQTFEALDFLEQAKLKELIELKELTICSYNPQYYKADDPVIITLTLKNVPSLMVKLRNFLGKILITL